VKRDTGLDVLLELNGTEYTEENGYWYKIEAWQVTPTPEIPHGIRYNLTLHNNYNKRIMGFDNAHSVKARKKRKYKGRIVEYDHVHETPLDEGTPYVFISADQLLKDFFEQVNKIMDGLRES
jgi:hypothetical protein